ncbi:hypothetical protein AB0478_33510 [Streptomyces sp. NPDC051917]|uniref:hypothetical protein n=1 Tax=Streptomyces sp. NPDC051917 TaxID=3154754 RepID=UPI00344BC1CC
MADALSPARLTLIMFLAIGVMVAWLLLYNHLWDTGRGQTSRRQVVLYDAATLTTLFLGVLCLYVLLYTLALVSAFIVIDSGYLASRLGLDTEEAVRQATYSRRVRERRPATEPQLLPNPGDPSTPAAATDLHTGQTAAGPASGPGQAFRFPAVGVEHLGEGGPAPAAGMLDQLAVGRHAQPLAEPHVHMITHEELPSLASSGPVIVEADRVDRQCRSSHTSVDGDATFHPRSPPQRPVGVRRSWLTVRARRQGAGAHWPDHPDGFVDGCAARAPGCGCG